MNIVKPATYFVKCCFCRLFILYSGTSLSRSCVAMLRMAIIKMRLLKIRQVNMSVTIVVRYLQKKYKSGFDSQMANKAKENEDVK